MEIKMRKRVKWFMGVLCIILLFSGLCPEGFGICRRVKAEENYNYNAYLFFQLDNYSFREMWNNEEYGISSSKLSYSWEVGYWNKTGGMNKILVDITDAVINENEKEYSVKISSNNLYRLCSSFDGYQSARCFNMLGISTNIPKSIAGVTAKASVIIDDKKVITDGTAAPAKGDMTDYYHFMLCDSYAPSDGTDRSVLYNSQRQLRTLPQKSLEIKFTISGLDGSASENAKVEETTAPDDMQEADSIEGDYSDINKYYDEEELMLDQVVKYDKVTLDENKTNVYTFQVEESGTYILRLTDESYGNARILVLDEDGKKVYESKVDPEFEKWDKTLELSEQKYVVKILSQEDIGFEYELKIGGKNAMNKKSSASSGTKKGVKKTKKVKITSCDRRKLNPRMGKGKWKSSDPAIVKVAQRLHNGSACWIWAKRAGKAVVTFTGNNGSQVKYKVIVSADRTYPFEKAIVKKDSAGRITPAFMMSNHSDRSMKHAYLWLSFYDAAGHKVYNINGHTKTVKVTIEGPLKPWKYSWYTRNNIPVFYNRNAGRMKVEKAKVLYSGGKHKTIRVNKQYKIH